MAAGAAVCAECPACTAPPWLPGAESHPANAASISSREGEAKSPGISSHGGGPESSDGAGFAVVGSQRCDGDAGAATAFGRGPAAAGRAAGTDTGAAAGAAASAAAPFRPRLEA